MTTLVVGDCAEENVFQIWDADAASEAEFEYIVASTLMCVYSSYRCFPFTGTFHLDGDGYRPDLALVAKDFSHWFIIEVELTSHSFEHHVLPQVRAFRYGAPQADCLGMLARALAITPAQAETMIKTVPRSVAVIANRHDHDWSVALRSHHIQFLSGTVYRSAAGKTAVELSGQLQVLRENLGFGIYSATYRTLRFPRTVRLPDGQIQIDDPDGGVGIWVVTRDNDYAWITKGRGTPAIDDGSYCQLILTAGGRISLRWPTSSTA